MTVKLMHIYLGLYYTFLKSLFINVAFPHMEKLTKGEAKEILRQETLIQAVVSQIQPLGIQC